MSFIVVLVAASIAAPGCGEGSSPGHAAVASPAPSAPAATSGPAAEPFRFFSPSSFWNTPVGPDARLDPSSAPVIASFAEEIEREQLAKSGPWINTHQYSVPIYTVSAHQPTVRVRLDHAPDPALRSAWSYVPLPPGARPATGTDAALVVWQPATDRMWEFWRLAATHGRWHAGWGGAMRGASSNNGVFGARAWPGAKPWWGSTASSLALAGGLITLEDLQRHEINHALAISVPHVRARVYALPARRTDGNSSDGQALPEGAHMRLDPTLDLTALNLPPLTLMIAQAAQRYGIIVRDSSPVVAFYAQDPTPTGSEPYAGPGGYFEGRRPDELLASFPWRHLGLLAMTLRRNRDGS